jgi:hypothetical protein
MIMMKANLNKAWTTHMGVLVRVLRASDGDVLEFGAGPMSTPLLHWVCKDMNRRLISYESDPDFYNFARQYRSRLHKIILVKNWDDVDAAINRGVVFIDHAPSTRRETDVIRFKNTADYIVMHDTDAKEDYSGVWPHFKHIYTWTKCRPWTSVVSNFKDLSDIKI